jgi:hypothetical protein
MRRVLIAVVLLSLVAAVMYSFHRRSEAHLPDVYAGERHVTLWSSTAMVREALMTLNYGERLQVVARAGDQVQVRTAQGVTGWVESRNLMDAGLWDRVGALLAQARTMPAQARGHTKVPSNLRVEPGRDAARILQLGRDVPVEFLARRVVDAPAAANEKASGEEPAEEKHEDWWMVRADVKDAGQTAGWVLGRFIALDLPGPLPDVVSSAGIHVVGWFELNHVNDAARGEMPQYVVVGGHGGESKGCDFTLLRVYTWGAARKRYETAYVESSLCGELPVRVTAAAQSGGDASFRFTAVEKNGKDERSYRMHQTAVRRVREGENSRAPAKGGRHRG